MTTRGFGLRAGEAPREFVGDAESSPGSRRAAATPPKRRGLSSVSALLNGMTREEHLDILSLDFQQIWWRVWLSREKTDLFVRKNAKFQSAFMRDDGGAALHRLVLQAVAKGGLLWEVPKGRHQSSRETDVFCAIRELREETGVGKGDYRLLPQARRRVCFVSAGTRYDSTYYIALAKPRLASRGSNELRRPLRAVDQVAEVGEIRWHDIEAIRFLDAQPRLSPRPARGPLESLVAPAFRLVKTYLKGRWAPRKSLSLEPRRAEGRLSEHETLGDEAAEPAVELAAGPETAVEPAEAEVEPAEAAAEPAVTNAAEGAKIAGDWHLARPKRRKKDRHGRRRGTPGGSPGPPSSPRCPDLEL